MFINNLIDNLIKFIMSGFLILSISDFVLMCLTLAGLAYQ